MEFISVLLIFLLGFFVGRFSVRKPFGVQASTLTPDNNANPSMERIPEPLVESAASIPETCGDPSLFSYVRYTYEGIKGIEITGYIGFDDSRIIIPDTIEELPVLSIGKEAFCRNNISEIVLPDSILNIGEKAFSKCKNLRTIKFPSGLKSIGKFAFSETTSLIHVTLPKGLTQLETGAFWSSGISEINFPSTLEVIPDMCCEDCCSLHKVGISEGIKRIGSSAFAISKTLCSHQGHKNNLPCVIIPKSVEYIDFHAFNDRDGVNLDMSTALVFEGMHTIIHKEITGKNRLRPENTMAYVLAGSETQKAARLIGFTVKPLSEFRNN